MRRQANQRDKPPGLLHDDATLNVWVWVKTWGQVIEDARARLDFFQQQLEYQVTDAQALSYLR